jgi:hypothetical protein
MNFKTVGVARLYDEVREWCHPEYPFLDRNYSPGANAPAIDFTPFVAEWLASGHLDAVFELLSFLTSKTDAGTIAHRGALHAWLPQWVELSEAARHELNEIHLLTVRASMAGGFPDAPRVGANLAATTIASRQLEDDASSKTERRASKSRKAEGARGPISTHS